MSEEFSRSELLLGKAALEKLKASKVIVFGVGGVGGYVVEALARSGVGRIDIVDNDTICESNINRQIIAKKDTIGKAKVEAMEERIHSIYPECEVRAFRCFYLPENKEQLSFSDYDYVIDCVDTVTAKLSLISEAYRLGVPIISAMGAGNKLDPTAFRVADIYRTRVCPLAKVIRRECKKRGIPELKVVYSEEMPIQPCSKRDELRKADSSMQEDGRKEPKVREKGEIFAFEEEGTGGRRQKTTPGSVSFVPPVCGFIIGGEVIKDLINKI